MKFYTIQITPGEHGHFGDEKRALTNALHCLIHEINDRNDMPPTKPTSIKGRDFSATISPKPYKYVNDGKPV
jgi:hypothetical protein